MQILPIRHVFLCLLLAGTTTNAGTVYDNGPPDGNTGFGLTHWMQADDFTLTRATRLESMTFWDQQVGTGNFSDAQHPHDYFLVRIYANTAGNTPGALLYDGRSTNLNRGPDTENPPDGFYPRFVNTFNFQNGPIDLPAGTYWIALHNGPFSNDISPVVPPGGGSPVILEVFFWSATM
ncbi:MAG TPA: hypothetical protein VF511_05625, partial [Chthoniobacterales bacterium]